MSKLPYSLFSIAGHALFFVMVLQLSKPEAPLQRKGETALIIQVDAPAPPNQLPAPMGPMEPTMNVPLANAAKKTATRKKSARLKKAIVWEQEAEAKAKEEDQAEAAESAASLKVAAPTPAPAPAKTTPTVLFNSDKVVKGGIGANSTYGAANGATHPNGTQAYYSKIMAILERHKEYPRQALDLLQQGTVYVKVLILPDGSIAEAMVVKPSRYLLLNQASLALFRNVRKFPPLPKSLDQGGLKLTLPVQYIADD